ncbi:AAA family ATPase [Streptomyces sp. S3(2020)]|uniref:helix-turn-helix transcriptional regulator n=1 Tax=Streptomyces sp. S3(2020) TaxID=2732044 RepID=UPI00148813E4|nr:LuxR family transcriptional regulator [Streptomyces sp. S3(2020)]NNN30765.1 AAA family ATPase [Streptomyces sp. S3(2020)]
MRSVPDPRDESAIVDKAFALLRAGRGTGLLITGAPGAGRSTFVANLRDRARGIAACAWIAPVDGAFPTWLQGWRSVASQLAAERPAGPAGELAAWMAAQHTVADRQLVERVATALEMEAAAGPIALFLDDAHRAEAVSACLVDRLLDAAERSPVLVGISVEMPTEDTGTPAWYRWRGHPQTSVVELSPLGDSDIQTLVRRTAPTALSPDTEREIVRVARGNPRLARELAAREALAQNSTRAPATGHPPTDGLARRMVIACEHGGVLATLAAAGRDISRSLLARAVVHSAETVSEVLDRAVAAGIVTVRGGPDRPSARFSHSMFAEVALALPSPERLVRVRASLVQALTEADPNDLADWTPPEIASHFIGVRDLSATAVSWSLRAALWCESERRPQEAVDFAAYGLLCGPGHIERYWLLRVLGRCADRTGDHLTATRTLSEAVGTARAMANDDLFAEAVADLAAATRVPELADRSFTDLVPLLRAAMNACSTESPATAARLRALTAETSHFDDFPSALALADDAARTVLEHQEVSRPVAAHVLATGAMIHSRPQGWDRALLLAGEAPDADSAPALRRMIPASTALCLARGDADELAALEAKFAALLESVPDVRAGGELELLRATRALLSGKQDALVRALRALPPALSEQERIMPAAMVMTWTAHTGRPLDIDPSSVRAPEDLATPLATLWASTEAVLAASAGDPDAMRGMSALCAAFRRAGPPGQGPTWSHEMAVRAQAASLAGDTALCRSVCDALSAYNDEFAVFSSYLPIAPVGWLVAEPLRHLGDFPAAYDANVKAEQVSRRLGARWWIARCLLQRARLFVGHEPDVLDGKGSAVVHGALDEALQIARDLDSARLFEEATRLRSRIGMAGESEGLLTLAAHGQRYRTVDVPATTSTSQASDPDRLTTRELDVFRLAATGMRNRDIAATLHLSVSTVERHCTSVYRKLDVRNRAQALGILVGWGDLPGTPERSAGAGHRRPPP